MIEMVFKRKYPKPELLREDLNSLRRIRSLTKEEKRRVVRASIILDYLEDYLDDNVYKWLSENLDGNDKYVGLIRHSADLVAHYSEKLTKDFDPRTKCVVRFI